MNTTKKIKRFFNLLFSDRINSKYEIALQKCRRSFKRKNRKKFYSLGNGCAVFKPLRIVGSFKISLGENAIVQTNAYLYANPNAKNDSALTIMAGTVIGNNCHIIAEENVVIDKNVLIADRVLITDSNHEYCDINKPIINQPITFKRKVFIGEGSWIGDGAAIMSCTIGKHCVIGANATVFNDVPDYSVVVGNPGRIVRHYSAEEQKWIKND